MGITLLAHTGKVAAGTSSAIDTRGATLIVVVTAGVLVGSGNVSDSKGNSPYTEAVSATGPSTLRNTISYFSNPLTDAAQTFTVTGTGVAFEVLAFSGILTTASPLDQTNSSGISGTQAGPITPTQDNEVVISSPSSAGASHWSVNGGYAISDQSFPNLSGNQSATGYLVQTSAVMTNPTWTDSGTGSEAVTVASFKATPTASAKKKASTFLVF